MSRLSRIIKWLRFFRDFNSNSSSDHVAQNEFYAHQINGNWIAYIGDFTYENRGASRYWANGNPASTKAKHCRDIETIYPISVLSNT